jgi:hypothetical protein
MGKLDLKQQLKHLYFPGSKAVTVVDVPEMSFVRIDGAIEPGHAPGNSPAFAEAVQALYGAAYTLKFMSKLRKDDPVDYSVMALEGLWWVDDDNFNILRPDNWKWTVMIMQPDHITSEMFAEALQQMHKKKGNQPAFNLLRLERFHEGLCMQIMHIGPYSDEPATVARMEAFAATNGYRKRGKHHEIYMGDPLRTAPEKLKTVLRHPIERI